MQGTHNPIPVSNNPGPFLYDHEGYDSQGMEGGNSVPVTMDITR
jgi:hypothetical protein